MRRWQRNPKSQALSHTVSKNGSKNGVNDKPITEHVPIYSIPSIQIHPQTPVKPNLSHDLEQYGRTVIVHLNNLFGVFKSETDDVFALIAHNYDWGQNGLLPFAEQYLEILCFITESTTWVSRKKTNCLIEKIKNQAFKDSI